MKHLILFFLALIFSLPASSQILTPVKWSYAAKQTSATEAILYIRAELEPGWHIYAQMLPEGGPVKTTFKFKASKSFKLVGHTTEPIPITKFEKTFNLNVNYFEKSVTFQQKVKLSDKKLIIKGSVEFMICSEKQCLPPQTINFTIPVR